MNIAPGLFDGDMSNFPEIYNWLVRQKRSAGIQHVSDAILENVIDSFDYVAAIFTGTFLLLGLLGWVVREVIAKMVEDHVLRDRKVV